MIKTLGSIKLHVYMFFVLIKVSNLPFHCVLVLIADTQPHFADSVLKYSL